MSKPVRIDVVSDLVCPWCFIGKKRLEKAVAMTPGIPVEVHFRPYFLNDWIPLEGIPREQYLTTKFGSLEAYKDIAQRVRAAAASEGLVYAGDRINRQPNTRDPHRLIRWAEGIRKAPEMKQRLMDLYFTEGADLSNTDVLVQAAAYMGSIPHKCAPISQATRMSPRSSNKCRWRRTPAFKACRCLSSAASSPSAGRRRRRIWPKQSQGPRRIR